MKYFIFLVLIFSSIVSYSQEKYRLFLYREHNKSGQYSAENTLIKTDQIYTLEIIDDKIIFKNEALKFELGNLTKVYFNGQYEGEFFSQIIISFTNINIKFYDVNTEYVFFKLYSEDEKY